MNKKTTSTSPLHDFLSSRSLLFILFDDSFVPDYAPPGPSFPFFSRSFFHTIFRTIQTTFFSVDIQKNLLSAVQAGRWARGRGDFLYVLQKLHSFVYVQFIIFLSSRFLFFFSFMNKTKARRIRN